MIPEDLRQSLMEQINHVDHPRELAVDVMFAIQDFYGSLTDEGVREAAQILGMSPGSRAAGHLLHVYLSRAGWEICDSCLRQRGLLDERL